MSSILKKIRKRRRRGFFRKKKVTCCVQSEMVNIQDIEERSKQIGKYKFSSVNLIGIPFLFGMYKWSDN